MFSNKIGYKYQTIRTGKNKSHSRPRKTTGLKLSKNVKLFLVKKNCLESSWLLKILN